MLDELTREENLALDEIDAAYAATLPPIDRKQPPKVLRRIIKEISEIRAETKATIEQLERNHRASIAKMNAQHEAGKKQAVREVLLPRLLEEMGVDGKFLKAAVSLILQQQSANIDLRIEDRVPVLTIAGKSAEDFVDKWLDSKAAQPFRPKVRKYPAGSVHQLDNPFAKESLSLSQVVEMFETDPERAGRLMKEAGWVDEPGGTQ